MCFVTRLDWMNQFVDLGFGAALSIIYMYVFQSMLNIGYILKNVTGRRESSAQHFKLALSSYLYVP